MSGLAGLEGPKAHERRITISSAAVGEGRVLVTGELVDVRTADYFLFTGERVPAGTLHHLVVRMLVDPATMTVLDAESAMIKVPRPQCREAENLAAKLKGLVITRGFTKRVKELFAGPAGCTHMTELILDMAPAAVQGIWAWQAREKPGKIGPGDIARMKGIREKLRDSCVAWRSDGPAYHKLVTTIDALAEGAGRKDMD